MGSYDMPLAALNFEDLNEFFDKYADGSGCIPIEDFISALRAEGRNVPPHVMRQLEERMARADINHDQIITYDEFSNMIRSKEGPAFRQLLHKYIHYTVEKGYYVNRYGSDGEYEEAYSCSPPKLFMTLFSVLELFMFIYDLIYFDGSVRDGYLAKILIYDPTRRKEVWRFVTYMFVHMGMTHLIVNLSIQILLGVPLEMVHGNWRVSCIYLSGILAGSLGTSISDPTVYLAGASGGVYALMTAHIATIIMNWSEMKYAKSQLVIFTCVIIVDVSNAFYNRYFGGESGNRIGYAAHFAGAVTGLLFGINILKNLRVKSWENKVWWASLVMFIILLSIAITINVAFPSLFPRQEI